MNGGSINNKGFSLIELTIVVLVMGILLSIAIPNYTHFQNKSRQAEVKANLEALYSAEKSFYFNNVYYSSRFDGIGFKPEGTLYYRTGFGADNANLSAANGDGTAGCINTSTAAACGAWAIWQESTSAQLVTLAATSIVQAVAKPTTFTAEAKLQNSSGNIDDWTIDEGKNLLNPTANLD